MSTGKTGTRYDEDFKRTLVNLYQSGGKTQAALCKEYGVFLLNSWQNRARWSKLLRAVSSKVSSKTRLAYY